MVVDKFGRQYSPGGGDGGGGKIIRGPPGIGFKLTSNGDFNVEHKKLTNVDNPEHDLDAVNRQSTLIVEKDSVSMRKRRLIDLKEPINESDAITMKYAQDLIKGLPDAADKAYVDSEIKKKTRKHTKEIRNLHNHIVELYGQIALLTNVLKSLYPLITNSFIWLGMLFKHLNMTTPLEYPLNVVDYTTLSRELLFIEAAKLTKEVPGIDDQQQ